MALRIGLIGRGAIGEAVVERWRRGELGPGLDLVGVLVRRPRDAAADGLPVTADRGTFLAWQPAVVLEVAGHAALEQHGAACLASGADLVVTSAGALTDESLHDALVAAAAAAGRRIRVAAAGIGALDILSAAAVGRLDAVRITVRKDPSAWYGTAAERIVDLAALQAPAILYEGPVRAGARAYPQNVNIAAAAALAGIGLDRTLLVIVADPGITDHVVEIEADGEFGRFRFREEIRPTVANPKTGVLVALAVVKTLRQLAATLVVGG